MTAGPEDELWQGRVADDGDPLPVIDRRVQFTGKVWSIVSDDVDFGTSVATRDVQLHPGAVAVIALDQADRVLLIRQYRHPVGRWLFEPPAGLLDEPGEPEWQTAARELAEETGYSAADWAVLVDLFLSPGGSSEAIRIYLARELTLVPGGRPHTGEAEESHLPRVWVDLDEARDLVLSGRIGSPSAVSGILAAWTSRESGWSSLRPIDDPWPARAALVAQDRIYRSRPSGA
jgi:8-oxo-dGTP pyrophosphatase MutT (NUDIX family)